MAWIIRISTPFTSSSIMDKRTKLYLLNQMQSYSSPERSAAFGISRDWEKSSRVRFAIGFMTLSPGIAIRFLASTKAACCRARERDISSSRCEIEQQLRGLSNTWQEPIERVFQSCCFVAGLVVRAPALSL